MSKTFFRKKIFSLIALMPLFGVINTEIQAGILSLDNGSIKINIQPEQGGRIVSFTKKGIDENLVESDKNFTSGVAKDRFWSDNWLFAQTPYNVIEQTKNSILLRVNGKEPPFDRIEITKRFTLDNNKEYLKVELTIKDTKPVIGDLKVAPWIHNQFTLGKLGENTQFYFPHEKGIHIVKQSNHDIKQPRIRANSNWMAFYNTKSKSGLIFAADPAPKILYSYIDKNACGSLEMLYDNILPVPEFKITYYLMPITEFSAAELKKVNFPLALCPAVPEHITQVTPTAVADNLEFSEYYQKSKEYKPLELQHWKSKGYLSPDFIYPLYFGIRLADKVKKPKLIFDIPEDIKLIASCAGYWNLNDKMVQASTENIILNNQKYTRYIFDINASSRNVWTESFARIFLSSDRKDGRFEMYYMAEYDGIKTTSKTIPFEIIKIPKSRVPEKFMISFGCDYTLVKNYPDFDRYAKHLGINSLAFNYNVPSQDLNADDLKKFLNTIKALGYSTGTMGWGFFQPPLDKPHAITVDGKEDNKHFEFTARGTFEDAVVKLFIEKAGKPGFDYVISDYEAYFSGRTISFSESTIAKFKVYFTENYPKLEYVDPKLIYVNPEKYPEQNKAWINFKSEKFADYLDGIVKKVKAQYPSLKIGLCTPPGASDFEISSDSLLDVTRISGFLDYDMPMLYNNLYRIMNKLSDELKVHYKLASKANHAALMPAISLNFWGEGMKYPPEDIPYMIYECIFSGAKGFYVFPGYAGADGLEMSYFSSSVNLIAENEEILWAGQRMDGLVYVKKAVNTDLKQPVIIAPKVIAYKDTAMIFLADYSGQKISVSLELTQDGDCSVTDAETKKLLHNLTDGNKTIDLTLDVKTKGYVLIIKNKNGTVFENKKTDQTAPLIQNKGNEKDLVFYEGFDENTKGINGTPEHYFSVTESSLKDKGLYLKDYESLWLYDKSIDLKSGSATIDFYWKPSFNIPLGSTVSLFTISLDENLIYKLEFVKNQGRLRLLGKDSRIADYNWSNCLYSKTEQWSSSVWYNMRVLIGPDGLSLYVNGVLESQIKPPKIAIAPIQKITQIKLGSRWQSFGIYDELKIFDGAVQASPDAH